MITRFDLDELYDAIEHVRKHGGPILALRKAYAELEAQLEQQDEIERRVAAILAKLDAAERAGGEHGH